MIHNMQLEKSEKYIESKNLHSYDVVICSALFEHLFTRKSFAEINNCVAPTNGCLIIHTRISGYIPNDPNWFYLDPPVHCAFHTNKSMEILMKQWGYKASIYCPQARFWVLLKTDNPAIGLKINEINKEFQHEYLVYKKGFVDYWSGY